MISHDKAKEIFEAGEDAVINKLSELSAEIDRLKGLLPDSPTTPSGQKPPFLKENKKKRNKKPGQKTGHKGTSRSALKPEDAHKTIRGNPNIRATRDHLAFQKRTFLRRLGGKP